MSNAPISVHLCGEGASIEGYARMMSDLCEAQYEEQLVQEDSEHARKLGEYEPDMVQARLTVDPYAPEPYEGERTEVEYVDAVFCTPYAGNETDQGNAWEWAEWL